MAAQRNWRFCANCFTLFFDGVANKGVCPTDDGHRAQGLEFALPHDVSETPTAQGAWRFCIRCSALFFNGFPQKGVCPAGREHQAQGLVFVIPHDVSETAHTQGAWRFCDKCNCMFFNGFPNAGVCPAGELLEELQEGSSGEAVKVLQRALQRAGFDPGPVDGEFGPVTAEAVRSFQAAKGLVVDGIVGPQTWGAFPPEDVQGRLTEHRPAGFDFVLPTHFQPSGGPVFE